MVFLSFLFSSCLQLSEDVLLPGIRDQLQDFYEHASPQDKARCLELLASLDISQANKTPKKFNQASQKRPTSAMGSLGDSVLTKLSLNCGCAKQNFERVCNI